MNTPKWNVIKLAGRVIKFAYKVVRVPVDLINSGGKVITSRPEVITGDGEVITSARKVVNWRVDLIKTKSKVRTSGWKVTALLWGLLPSGRSLNGFERRLILIFPGLVPWACGATWRQADERGILVP